MSTQFSQFEAETPKFIQFSQLTGRSQAQLENKRFFAAYVLIEYNQFGGTRKEILLIADSEIQAQKYEREFPAYRLIVGIPRFVNAPAELQAIKSEKIGPAFNSNSNSIQKPAHKEPIVNNPDGSITLNPKFQIGETVLVVAGVSWAKIQGYMIYKGEILYLTDSGELRADEAKAQIELEFCPKCGEQSVLDDHCHDCGADAQDEPAWSGNDAVMPHPSMSVYERNHHSFPDWRK